MWSSCCALLMLLLLCRTVLYNGAVASRGHCAELRDAWQRRIDNLNCSSRPQIVERSVLVDRAALTVEVWGAGDAERAAAAAQLALLRVVLGYRARLRLERADLCSLVRRGGPQGLAVVAPAARVPRFGCGAAHIVAVLKLTELVAGPAVPAAVLAAPLLFARAPNASCAGRAAAWLFYADPAGAKLCDFLLSSDGRVALLARPGDAPYAATLAALPALQLAVRTFNTDLDFRRRVLQLRDENRGFLFIDEDIWLGEPLVVRVPPPPCAPPAACARELPPGTAVRVGDGLFMRQYAPQITRVVDEVEFTPEDLRTILEYEARQAEPNITEAACQWARTRLAAQFDQLVKNKECARAPAYSVALLACADEPAAELAAAAGAVRDALSTDVQYSLYAVACADEGALRAAVDARARERRTLAAVAWSAAPGLRAAAAAAASAGLPLLLVGAAAEPAAAARAPSGRLAELARAYRHLLAACEWSRVAVLSERSAYAQSFARALLAGSGLLHREVALDEHSAAAALDALRGADARVVVLNARWNVSAAVVCGAAPGLRADVVWLAREWRATPCAAGARVVSADASWRGGAAQGGLEALRERLSAAWPRDALVPPLVASLADALVLVTLALRSFLRAHPSPNYDFRGNASLFAKYLDEVNATGVAGELRAAEPEPLVFVHVWSDERAGGRAAAVWRVARGGVAVLWQRGAHCAALLGAPPVRDRPACRTARVGDAFAPRCLDAPLLAGGALLLLGALALAGARRVRRAALRRREADALRRRAASQLAAFLVDRAAVTLLHEIGAGSFAHVHAAELRRPGGATLRVAAKSPRQGAAPAEEREFLREACVLAPLAHAHVVRLLGVCVASEPPLLLLEHAPFLDLRRYLAAQRRAGGLSARALTRLAREAAEALAYLAARRLVHRDVRAANCLVDARRALKLADFGLARALDDAEPEYASTRRGLFPVLWMAPESLSRGVFSPASDVWALGVLLLELATLGARPFGRWPPARVLHFVAAGGHAPLPPDLAPDTRELVLWCWHHEPERRPSAELVRRALAEQPRAVRAAFVPPAPPVPPTPSAPPAPPTPPAPPAPPTPPAPPAPPMPPAPPAPQPQHSALSAMP